MEEITLEAKALLFQWSTYKNIRRDRLVFTYSELDDNSGALWSLINAGYIKRGEHWESENKVLQGLSYKITADGCEFIATNEENLSELERNTWAEAARYLRGGVGFDYRPDRNLDLELFSHIVGDQI